MTYDAREQSATSGRPVELFTFGRDYQRWRYTSADRDISTLDGVFAARPITRSAIEASPERARSNITLTAPRDLEVADLYRIAPPTLAVTCIVQQLHQGDPDAQVVTLWSGRIASVDFLGQSAQITLEPVQSSLRRIGLRRAYQRQCTHVLYGTGCNVNREAFRVDGTVDSVPAGGVVVPEAATQPDGFFAGGYVEWEVELGIAERRFISDHTGTALALTANAYGLQPGQAVKLYPGCDHQLSTCQTTFANSANYGGFPFFPLKNPFGGDPVF